MPFLFLLEVREVLEGPRMAPIDGGTQSERGQEGEGGGRG